MHKQESLIENSCAVPFQEFLHPQSPNRRFASLLELYSDDCKASPSNLPGSTVLSYELDWTLLDGCAESFLHVLAAQQARRDKVMLSLCTKSCSASPALGQHLPTRPRPMKRSWSGRFFRGSIRPNDPRNSNKKLRTERLGIATSNKGHYYYSSILAIQGTRSIDPRALKCGLLYCSQGMSTLNLSREFTGLVLSTGHLKKD